MEKIKNIIAEWLATDSLPDMIERDIGEINFDQLSSILAIVGPRRSGKTWYMYQLINSLLAKGIEKNDILFIDFEDYRLIGIRPEDIDTILTTFYKLTNRYPGYLFFDEIQNLPNWSRVLRTLHNQNRYKIVVSGSNSNLLSREIATELRGRYEDLLMLPFSFIEFLTYKNISFDKTTFYTPKKGALLQAFEDYLKAGGFPEVVKKESTVEKNSLLQSYFQTLFYKDLLERYRIRSKNLLNAMMRYCLDTMGDLFSISRFADSMIAADIPVSKKTISNYLHHLQEAFFLIVNEKFDYSPRKRLMNPKKLYLMDSGFSALSVSFSENKGKFLENVVAVHLYRKREEMYYYRKEKECDFLVKRGKEIHTAIQVCWELNQKNRKRELSGLAEAMRMYDVKQGLVLTYDQEGSEEIDGHTISILPTWQWLLAKELV
ncbi:ATP-binding protein [bacterium]|nr:ATP-binding protein [bacterium]